MGRRRRGSGDRRGPERRRAGRSAVCLWIGEAVFAGILLDGRPWTGAHGLAGSAAWLTLNPVDRQDYRKYGGLAAEVSDRGIAGRIAWRIQAGDSSDVLERAGGQIDAITAAHVYEAARQGDGVALSVVRDTGRYIGMAAANLANVIDPEVVVIAGPVAAYGDLLLEPVRAGVPPAARDRTSRQRPVRNFVPGGRGRRDRSRKARSFAFLTLLFQAPSLP